MNEKLLESSRAYKRKYKKSEKGIASEKRYTQSKKFKERIKEYNYNLRRTEEHRKWKREYDKRRRDTEPQFKLSVYLRARLRKSLKKGYRTGSAIRDLGCTILELKAHIERQFKPGMTWENWTKSGWHIDHIKPVSKFDLTDRAQLLEACHYTNLQPLWAVDNMKKSNKIL